MADITASMVKDLRETTGAGMMDCRRRCRRPTATSRAAVDLLRVKGLAKAAKKADRVASEGVVAVATARTRGSALRRAAIELNSKPTSSRATRPFRRRLARSPTRRWASMATLKRSGRAKVEGGQTAAELAAGLVATIGENMALRRAARLSVDQGAVGVYVHNKAPGRDRSWPGGRDRGRRRRRRCGECSRNWRAISLYTRRAIARLLSLSADEMEAGGGREGTCDQTATAAESGKPANVIEKMVEGRIRKWMRGSRPSEAGLCEKPRPDRRATGRRHGETGRLADQGCRFHTS